MSQYYSSAPPSAPQYSGNKQQGYENYAPPQQQGGYSQGYQQQQGYQPQQYSQQQQQPVYVQQQPQKSRPGWWDWICGCLSLAMCIEMLVALVSWF